MAKVEWLFTCDYSMSDQTNKVSIIGIFEEIYSPHIPTVHPIFYTVFKVVGNPGENINLELLIKDPDMNVIGNFKQPSFDLKKGSMIINVQFRHSTFNKFGSYGIYAILNGVENPLKGINLVQIEKEVQKDIGR